ncbi:type I polyketide synthase [Streptomyces sp. NPDC126514]|uniref:type I polyketide synthase n=1 Tax=Streptomyces sp. NPDC126514 TaxID=3155210 RepID=UPI003329C52A
MTITVPDTSDSTLIAVIGMAGRFPGAADVEEFWHNLCEGRNSITVLDADPLDADAPGVQRDPRARHTAAYGILRDADHFDAGFFGISPREALVMDPQQRVLMETASHALEDAGYDPFSYRGEIGLFAGGSTTRHRAALEAHRARLPFLDDWQIQLATAPDFLTTKVAARLRLRGPVLSVQSACSTSLVAVHLACQALLAGECDIVLAGGAAVHVHPPRASYVDGGIVTSNGMVRAFDAGGQGTVGGSAAALVVLKPLAEALADGDHVHAVIRGTAVCNDGGDSVGFTAPGVDGQTRAIRAAQLVAGIDARTITYVEAHGTGTPLGDPIEAAALTKAFRADTDDNAFCLLGSAKTNIGHTDAAAGVTGLIKTVLAVEHAVIPPSLNFEVPNPEIPWNTSPFRVVTERTPWPSTPQPRRAAVNALGLGGTNAHAVVEQTPEPAPATTSTAPQLLVLSARTPAALEEVTTRLATRLTDRPDLPLADVAWTLQTGRTTHSLRRYAVVSDTADAAHVLQQRTPGRIVDVPDGAGASPTPVFMFPGQGSQHVGMARELYAGEPEFRRALDECCTLARPDLGLDLRDVLMPEERGTDPTKAAGLLAGIAVSQPAVFAVEYALAQLWRAWQVHPVAVIGHSLGAYAAATVAGVLTLADAARLVVERGRLLQGLPTGAMLALEMSEEQVLSLLPPGLTVAAVNGPRRCTVSGPAEPVVAFAADLGGRGIDSRLLRIPTAGHSALVEPIMEPFEKFVSGLDLRPPQIPFLSDMTGTWAEEAQLTDPAYWSAHLRSTVRFSQALETLVAGPRRLLLEVGPGRTLATLTRQHPAVGREHRIVHSMPHPSESTSERAVLLAAAGQLWSASHPPAWGPMHQERRRTVKLPLYPFERQQFPLECPMDTPVMPTTASAFDEPFPLTHAESTPAPAAIRPRSATPAARIAQALADSLGLSDIGEHDNFFDRGGDSLMAARLAAWIRETFAVDLPTKDVFLSPTAAALAQAVAHRMGTV